MTDETVAESNMLKKTRFPLRQGGLRTSGILLLAAGLAAPAAAMPSCEALADAAPQRVEAAIEAEEAPSPLVRALAGCLGHKDPQIRDAMAFTRLAELLRAGAVTEGDRRALLDRLSANLAPGAPDPEDVLKPFSALVLAEVARTDRIDPWLIRDERVRLVETGAAYLESVRDYRGFTDGEGWRHGVAHGADLLMQLSLNEALARSEAERILEAIGAQIASDAAPAYIFDEPRRLARPVLFLTRRGHFTEDELTAWFEELADPAPLSAWGEAFSSESALARRHNLRAFGYAVLVSATESGDATLARLRPGAIGLLTTVP